MLNPKPRLEYLDLLIYMQLYLSIKLLASYMRNFVNSPCSFIHIKAKNVTRGASQQR